MSEPCCHKDEMQEEGGGGGGGKQRQRLQTLTCAMAARERGFEDDGGRLQGAWCSKAQAPCSALQKVTV